MHSVNRREDTSLDGVVSRDSLLLVLPVPFRRDTHGNLLVERQASNGLDRWADHFSHLMVAAPLQPETAIGRQGCAADYVPVDRICARDRMDFVPLPWAYQVIPLIRSYRDTRKLLADCIRRCEYLSFAIGGLVGDWAAVAAIEAIRQRRPFSVWTDRVEHRVVKTAYVDKHGVRRLYSCLRDNLVVSPLMKRLEKYVISRCDLGLFHGRDCYDAYSPHCRNPHVVHNIHLKPEEAIAPERVQTKMERIRLGKPLTILYAGRADGMKGPLDWVRVLATLNSRGVSFNATWIGEGEQLALMREEASRCNLGQVIRFPGYVDNRELMFEALREADLFVFCHKTAESPRCLIEALMSGTPIVGYSSPYPRDLLGNLAENLLVDRDDIGGLAERIKYFNDHREKLAEVVRSCAQIGAGFSDQSVFEHRSHLIKDYLGLDKVRSHSSPLPLGAGNIGDHSELLPQAKV